MNSRINYERYIFFQNCNFEIIIQINELGESNHELN